MARRNIKDKKERDEKKERDSSVKQNRHNLFNINKMITQLKKIKLKTLK